MTIRVSVALRHRRAGASASPHDDIVRVAGYVLVQLVGALAAAAVLRALFGNAAHLGATLPQHSTGVALATEVLLTLMLVSVILGTSNRHRMLGPNAAVAVGATIVACTLFGKGESGGSMNPARSLGPALVSGALEWVYAVGPLAGATLAVGLAFLIHGAQKDDEKDAAKGG